MYVLIKVNILNREIAAITVVSGQSVEVKDSLGASQVKGHVEQFNGNTFISYEVSVTSYFLAKYIFTNIRIVRAIRWRNKVPCGFY